jgi:uncharacterized damage-inducible protein DinB
VKQDERATTLLKTSWEQVSTKTTRLAGEIPEDKLHSHPVTGIRTCSKVLRHVAFWKQYLADSLAGKPADDTLNELPQAKYHSKPAIFTALEQTSEDVARKITSGIDVGAQKSLITFLEFTSEHYGQLVIYARLMGIIPPASRG